MIFTSFAFVVFLITIFVLYWFVFKSIKAQNTLLLLGSYFFYGYWDWRFVGLLFLISLANYFIAKNLTTEVLAKKKVLIGLGIALNLGILFIFKYFNFFIEGFQSLLSLLHINFSFKALQLILPIGISFYIFLSLSYLIDVYQNKLKPCSNIIDLLLSLSFFPIILAGPIQRPISLIPQIQNPKIFQASLASDGLRQILWGVFMKVVIADKCASYANIVFDGGAHSSTVTLLGIFMYSIQIYADFAGYSHIAIGTSKLFGYDIMQNFAYPYFSRSIKQFWQRWNISLTNWFRDYVFLPIAYSVSGKIKSENFMLIKTDIVIYIISISITWIATGLWHGANYTLIIWGLYHGALLIIYHLLNRPKNRLYKRLKVNKDNNLLIALEIGFTFCLIMISWIFFRSADLQSSFQMIRNIFTSPPQVVSEFSKGQLITLIFIFIFLLFEWAGRKQEHPLATLGFKWKRNYRWALYYILIISIYYFSGEEQKFIYFQF